MRTLLVIVLITALGVTSASATVSGTIAINQTNPTFGSYVNFTWTCDGCPKAPKSAANIYVTCFQNAALVYGQAGPADQWFLLGGSMSQWVLNGGGPATCHADLYYYSYQGGSQQYNEVTGVDFNAAG